jgi:DNA transformation protein and related proteins
MGREYCDYLIDALGSWGAVTAKRMFGGWGLYRDGQIFAIVIEDTPYFKVDESNRADYESAGVGPFAYMARGDKRTVMSYWQVPGDVLDDEDALKAWAEKALRVALKSAAEKAKKRQRATSMRRKA